MEPLTQEHDWLSLVMDECPVRPGPRQEVLAHAIAARRSDYMRSETAALPDVRNISVIIIPKTNIFIDLNACRDVRFEAGVLVAAHFLNQMDWELPAIASVFYKVLAAIKQLDDDEAEIIRRIARVSEGDIYDGGASSEDLLAAWPDSPENLLQRLRLLERKGVLTETSNVWTVIR